MEFVAIDVETANADMSSICQIGIACYNERSLSEEWKSYIDPEDYFDAINISIHGIDESTVIGSPKLYDVANQIYKYLEDHVCVCHTHFDRVAIRQAFDKYEIRHPNCTWLDSARVTRRAWEDLAWKGYGLYNVCKSLGYDFAHHDALEDAKAAGHILITAINRSGLDIDGWLKRVEQPIDPTRLSTGQAIQREGNPEGPLYGEILVFTGTLGIPRREAAGMASQIGCHVASGVTKETTILVVGDQDIKRLAGHEKSSKHRKAENLILNGQSIRIISETDFKKLADLAE
jgi:DNA polymerase-3 subunit epsilon